MNGRKAKKLRREASVKGSEVKYDLIKRRKDNYQSTVILAECPRKVYQKSKRNS